MNPDDMKPMVHQYEAARLRQEAYRPQWCDRCLEHHSVADGHRLAPRR